MMNWQVVIDFAPKNIIGSRIKSARLGLLPGEQAAGSAEERWLIPLRPFEHMERVRRMDEPLSVNFNKRLPAAIDMNPTATAPTTRDWGWFGSQPVASIAKIGVDESDPATWVRGGYAWLYERLTNEDHDHLPPPIADPSGPPKDRIPFPGVRPDGNGCIGFVSVEFSDTRPRRGTDDTEDAVQSAADYLSDAFRQLDHSTKWPRVLSGSCIGWRSQPRVVGAFSHRYCFAFYGNLRGCNRYG